jgi:hypothetical protein
LFHRRRVGGIGRNDTLDGASLDGDSSDGDSSETSTTDDDGLSPSRESLLERTLVEETAEPLAIGFVGLSSEEPTRVVSTLDRGVVDRTVPVVDRGEDGERSSSGFGNVGEPANDAENTFQVVGGGKVRDSVLVHDLSSSELQVRGVDFATENLVERSSSGEDDGLTFDLNSTLTETDEVSSDTDRTGRDESDGEDVVVGTRSFSGNETRSLERFDSETVLKTDDVGDLVTNFTVLLNLLSDDGLFSLVLELSKLLGSEVEVLEALLGTGSVDPGDVEDVEDLLGDTETSSRVGREVNSRETEFASEFGNGEEVLVFSRSEGSNLEGDVVGDDYDSATSGSFRSVGSVDPTNHSDVVRTRRSRDFLRLTEFVENEFLRDEGFGGSDLSDGLPLLANRLTEEIGEVVGVSGTDDVSLVALGLKPLLSRVRRVDGLKVESSLRTDRLEDNVSLFGGNLSVSLVLDNESRNVLDDGSDRLDVALGVFENDTDLGSSDSESPESLAVTIDESSESGLNLFEVETETVEEVELAKEEKEE